MRDMCAEPYQRPEKLGGELLWCHFLPDHNSRHSWYARNMQDVADAERLRSISDDTPADVRVLLDNITCGRADTYLEAILAVTHNRKRHLRGTPGFR